MRSGLHGGRRSVSGSGRGGGGKSPLSLLLAAVALFAISRGYILGVLEPRLSDIRDVYFTKVARAVDLQQTPYQSGFLVEYPPVAWWTMCVPRLVDRRRINDPKNGAEVVPVYESYRRAFRGLMFFCDAASLVLLVLIIQRRRPGWVGWAALTYTVATALLGHVLYDRLDVGLLLLLMGWSYAWLRSAESEFALGWSAAAYAALGFGISYKLIPVVSMPFLLLSEWRAPRRWMRLATSLLILSVTAAGPFVIQYAISGPGVFTLFRYHSERGIQLESVYASLMLLGSVCSIPARIAFDHGAFELVGSLAQPMKTASTVLLLGLLSGLGLRALLLGSRFTREEAYRTALFLIPAAAVLSPVLSPQYFVWMIPLWILLAMEILPERMTARWLAAGLLVAIAGLTTWVFPYHYFYNAESPSGLVPWPFVENSAASALASAVLARGICSAWPSWFGWACG